MLYWYNKKYNFSLWHEPSKQDVEDPMGAVERAENAVKTKGREDDYKANYEEKEKMNEAFGVAAAVENHYKSSCSSSRKSGMQIAPQAPQDPEFQTPPLTTHGGGSSSSSSALNSAMTPTSFTFNYQSSSSSSPPPFKNPPPHNNSTNKPLSKDLWVFNLPYPYNADQLRCALLKDVLVNKVIVEGIYRDKDSADSGIWGKIEFRSPGDLIKVVGGREGVELSYYVKTKGSKPKTKKKRKAEASPGNSGPFHRYKGIKQDPEPPDEYLEKSRVASFSTVDKWTMMRQLAQEEGDFESWKCSGCKATNIVYDNNEKKDGKDRWGEGKCWNCCQVKKEFNPKPGQHHANNNNHWGGR
jgi:hypothetical protein